MRARPVRCMVISAACPAIPPQPMKSCKRLTSACSTRRRMDDLPRKGYLYKTATNLLRDRWRKQKREQKLWEMSDFTEHVHQKFNLPLDMASVFDRLSAQERAILWLAHVEEMSHKEIGAVYWA